MSALLALDTVTPVLLSHDMTSRKVQVIFLSRIPVLEYELEE